ncbi:type II toxin-antitoxin system YafQ family toxin [Leptotrichia sp. oral taxon 879]|uniref:type II toxin-antitoxin system YafQ family toxin n=1 Tax=Leptotrichia sp. oral taxon 879 TaxID=1227267 RepID=UPI0003AE5259|nr:type II toxin-antitoxin system YafQ family toxin [Leptotrichia sp. oral taxon 879]ERK55641.1 addiction module toxin, RelE/StbE family [Leptotrichia sp. oral taxon 879 str. F0557]
MKMNKYNLKYTNRFSKDLKLIKKRGYNLKLLEKVVKILINSEKLSVKNKDYALKDKYLGYRECCITSDWLLVYKIIDKELILLTTKTKTPSSLF